MDEIEFKQCKSSELIEQLKKTNRLYAVLSNINQMILHIKDKEKIYTEACRIAHEEGNFTMAWIGLPDPETGIITPKCWAGKEEGYLSSMHSISKNNIPGGRGPTGIALRERKTVVANDFASDPRLELWRDEALKRGYASSIALPIFTSTKEIGTFTIYASEKNFFNETEISLLQDLAANIAFALEALENEEIKKKAEEEIADKNKFIKTVTDSLPGLVGYWTKDLRCNFANYGYQKWFGKSESEMMDIGIEEFLGEEMYLKTLPYIHKALNGEHQQFERTLKNADGTHCHFYMQFVPNIVNDQVLGYFILGSDITKFKEVEMKIEEERLVSSSKMAALGEMASGIAHEINNPLSIIVMKISQLRRKYEENTLTENELDEGLTKLALTAQRIGSVVKGLSSISRNAENDPMKKIKIANLIEETLQLCREKFRSNTIDLYVDLDLISQIEIEAKAPQIMQVLLNLLNNAFDAIVNVEEKWIKVHAIQKDDGIEISITDSGKGIPDHMLGKITQPFFTTKEPGKGTGLGLSISKGIIEEHQGQFYYRKNNENTCFVVELPYLQKNLRTS